MRKLFIILFLALSVNGYAQDYKNVDKYWQAVVVDTSVYIPPRISADSIMIMVSNRATDTGAHFMGEHRDPGHLTYFYVYILHGKRHVIKLDSFAQAIRMMPQSGRDWVVYTEGMGKTFPIDIHRGLAMAATYHVNVLVLDYPSIRSTVNVFRNYFFAKHNSRIAYRDFVPVLEDLKKLRTRGEMGNGHLALFFHSMGNNVVRQMVRHKKLAAINNEIWVDNLVLNAPCVPQRRHRKWLNKIHFAKNVYVHYNPNDKVLSGAHLASLKKQLGEKVRSPLATNVHYINFNIVAGEAHSNFLTLAGRPPMPDEAFEHYLTLFHGGRPDIDHPEWYHLSLYRGLGSDILKH